MIPIRQAVIMAAGLGTRLRPLTETVPKPLLKVAGRPILEWNIDALPKGITEVILVVGYRQEQIRGHFGTEWHGRHIRYVEQTELKGTGHTVHLCRPILDERFLVMNGDDLYGSDDISRIIESPLALLVKQMDDTGRFGTLETDSKGNFLGIAEGLHPGEPGLVNIGLYVLNADFFRYDLVPLKKSPEFGLPQTIAAMAKDFPIAVVPADFWIPIGFPEDLERATALLTKPTPTR